MILNRIRVKARVDIKKKSVVYKIYYMILNIGYKITFKILYINGLDLFLLWSFCFEIFDYDTYDKVLTDYDKILAPINRSLRCNVNSQINLETCMGYALVVRDIN